MRFSIVYGVLAVTACSDALAPKAVVPLSSAVPGANTPRDGFVSVAPDVRLHYLDYGGMGETVVLLAGLGNTAHVFDDFGPRLTKQFHVLAITRRGFGASSQPASGYDTRTLTEDLRIVLDSLHLTRVDIVGHSVAGDEMTRLAADHPDRVGKLVYLDAAYDRVDLGALLAANSPPPPPAPTARDLSSFAAFSRYVASVRGVRLPDSELRASYLFAPDGSVAGEVSSPEVVLGILLGEEHPNYAAVRAPTLGIFAVARDARYLAPWLNPASPDWSATAALLSNVFGPFYAAQRARFASEVVDNRIIELSGANHYVFISDPGRTTRAVLAFLESR